MVNPAYDFTYVVEGESAFGCKAKDSVRVTVQQRFTVTAAPGDTLCVGEAFQLRANGAEQYTWTPAQSLDNATSATPIARPQTTVQYQVIGKDNNNCFTDTSYVDVIVYPYPKVELGEDRTVIIGESITLKPDLSADVNRLQWTPATWLNCNNCPAPVVTPKQTIQYQLTASNLGGCTTEDNITLFVVCRGENMFLPNTFSPNGNGKNEVFYPRGKGLSFIKNFRIYNRWGEVVFQQHSFNVNDRTRGWNGMYKGTMALQDVYVYTIEVVCDNCEVLSFKGDVTLLR
jgi:gliding motility-associated-like protein